MSLERDVGDAVGAAMTIGLAIGLQRQRDKNVGSWEHHAKDLRQQLSRANQIIDQQNNELIEKSVAVKREQNQVAALQQELQRKDAALTEQKALLAREKEKVQASNNVSDVLTGHRVELKRKLKQQCVDTAVLLYLYESLVDEINTLSDPDNFTTLHPENRLAVAREKWKELDQSMKPPPENWDDSTTIGMTYEVVLKPPKR